MANKRAIDKENMFRKIMPSAAVAQDAQKPAEGQPPGDSAAASGGGPLSDDAIAALFAQQNAPAADAPPAPAADVPPVPVADAPPARAAKPSIPEATDSKRMLSADEIAALFAQHLGEDAPSAPSAPASAASGARGGPLNDDAIAALFAQRESFAAEGAAAEENAPEAPAFERPAEPVAAAEPEPDEAAEPPRPVNLAHILLEEYYPRYRQRLNACGCQRCRDDACGMALNRITPRYTTSDRLNPEDLKDRALITESVTALIHCMFVVKAKPNHSEAELMQQFSTK